MSVEQKVTEHYSKDGLAAAILEAARNDAADPDNLTTEDLAPFDDMHVGGRKGTLHLMEKLALEPGMRVLEIGSGIGGPARVIAAQADVHVTGIDLTPSYKQEAETLSAALGLSDKTAFVTGSALDMPFDAGSFDAAYMIHVGMNIDGKSRLFAETQRVLKPCSAFGIYDIMGLQDEMLAFPLPWAATRETSFLELVASYEAALVKNGFEITGHESRRDFALKALEKLFEMEEAGQMPERPYPIRSEGFPEKVRNLYKNIKAELIAPHVIVAKSVGRGQGNV